MNKPPTHKRIYWKVKILLLSTAANVWGLLTFRSHVKDSIVLVRTLKGVKLFYTMQIGDNEITQSAIISYLMYYQAADDFVTNVKKRMRISIKEAANKHEQAN